jgi:hypothetical protein
MGTKSPEGIAEVIPQELKAYEEWWGRTYGREITAEELHELVSFAKDLMEHDDKFKQILADRFMAEFGDSDNGLEDPDRRKWSLISALSTYGKKFGLKVD